MSNLVSIELDTGTLRRYACRGTKKRLEETVCIKEYNREGLAPESIEKFRCGMLKTEPDETAA